MKKLLLLSLTLLTLSFTTRECVQGDWIERHGTKSLIVEPHRIVIETDYGVVEITEGVEGAQYDEQCLYNLFLEDGGSVKLEGNTMDIIELVYVPPVSENRPVITQYYDRL